LFAYLTSNHFTWDYPFHEELTPEDWRDPGNAMPEINEWLRRQAMSERDYKEFIARLEHDFPGEPFLIVRYGDHQPDFGKLIVERCKGLFYDCAGGAEARRFNRLLIEAGLINGL